MKATKVYKISNYYQLAKRVDGCWFYREWINSNYGYTWSRWRKFGKITKVEIVEDSTKAEFADSYECMVKKIHVTFDNRYLIRIRPDSKTYKSTVRLPND